MATAVDGASTSRAAISDRDQLRDVRDQRDAVVVLLGASWTGTAPTSSTSASIAWICADVVAREG